MTQFKLIAYKTVLITLLSLTALAQTQDQTTLSSQQIIDQHCAQTVYTFIKISYEKDTELQTPVFDKALDLKFVQLMNKAGQAQTENSLLSSVVSESTAAMQEAYKIKPELALICETYAQKMMGPCFKNPTHECLKERLTSTEIQTIQQEYIPQFSEILLKDKKITPAELIIKIVTSSPTAAALVFGLFALIIIIVLISKFKKTSANKHCPQCNADLPPARVPHDFQELLWGGWTCQRCGAKWTHDLKRRY